jgi:autotransporter-associated beta strand protein
MKGHARFALGAGIFLLWSAAAFGATRTWTGASINTPFAKNNFWTNEFNWAGNVAPAPGDDLVFNGGFQGATSVNTFQPDTTFNSITITNHAINGGNRVALNAFLSGTGALINLPIILNASQTFTATTAGSGLTFSAGALIETNGNTLTLDGPGSFVLIGAISGTGGITKDDSGSLQFAGNHSYTGDTTILDGPVRIAGDHSGSRFVTFGFSGLIGGAGTVKGLIASDPIDPGAANNGTGILASTDGLDITTNGSLQIDIKGTTPGDQFDQVQVTGAVQIDLITGLFGAGLNVELVGFTPAPGDSFVIISNDGTDPITNGSGAFAGFFGRPEGSSFTLPNSSGGNTTFFITYRGGDGNDVVLHVPREVTWDGGAGGGDNTWTTAANWAGDLAPQVGDTLIFPGGTAAQRVNYNDFPPGTTFTAIRMTDGNYVLGGNEVRLVTELAGLMPSTAGGGVIINFVLSGPGQVRLDSGTFLALMLNNANTYTGGTLIHRGVLHVSGSQPNIPVTVEAGTLGGAGALGAINVTDGVISPGTFLAGQDLAILTTKSVSFGSSSSVLSIQLKSSAGPGSGHDQLNVNGTVTLNNARLTLSRASSFSLPPVGSVLTILNNDGSDPINGTFLNLPEGTTIANPGAISGGGEGSQAVISYQGGDGNDVTLTFTSAPTPTPTPTPTPNPGVVGNVSTRLPVGAGDDVLIEGFTVQGAGGSTKKIIVRALGPFLIQFGILDALPNPTLEIYEGNTLIATNDNWRNTQVGGIITGDQSAEIEASGLAPSNDLESAIIANLGPGSYTAVVRGVNNTTGTGIVDAFDLSAASPARVVNFATRGLIQPGDQLMIAGFIIQNGSVRAVIRAIGPSLTQFGISNALPDTTLEVRNQDGTFVMTNDDWETNQKQELENTGLQPGNAQEAAIVATLPPGQYSALVRGKPESTGTGVVEVYFIQ